MTDFRTWTFTRNQKILFYLCASMGLMGISLLLYRNILFSVVMIPALPKLRSFAEEKVLERKRREYLTEFKDFLFIAATAIGAGRSMKDAIGESIPGLIAIYDEKGVFILELQKVYRRIDSGNENDMDVLGDLAILSGMEDVIDFVTIYSTCKVTGASLIRAMNQAAAMIIDKMTIEREIRELVKRKEMEGLIILAVPVLVILFLNLSAPDYIAPLYNTLTGRLIMTAVFASVIGIYEMVLRIVKVDI